MFNANRRHKYKTVNKASKISLVLFAEELLKKVVESITLPTKRSMKMSVCENRNIFLPKRE